MNLFKNALDQASLYANKAQQFVNDWTKEDRLKKNLTSCTYSDDSKFVIEKAVKQVFHVYPFFDSDVLTFVEQNQTKKYLEIKAIMEVQVKGIMHKVDYNMMIPTGFPKKPPYVRIIKPGNEYTVDKYYQSMKSPTDPNSFILNEKLKTVKKWEEHSSLVNIIIESQDMMRNLFPFINSKNQQPQQQWGNQWPNQNQGFNNQNNQGFFNQGHGNQGYQQKPPPPIPFKTASVTEIIANGQKYVGNTRQLLTKMNQEHLKASEKIRDLEQCKSSLESEEEYLRHENMKMMKYLRMSEDFSNKDLTDLIETRDELSDQILDLMSSIKSREDCIEWLQKKVSNDQITFDQFIKNIRKMQEEKFEEKVLLAKCLSHSK